MTKIKCTHCGDIIESDGKGKFVQCSCGKIYIDETEYYCRIGGGKGDFTMIREAMIREGTTKDKLLEIVNHYGLMKQLKYIHSEYFELDEAILNEREISFNSEGDIGDLLTLDKAKGHIAEEIADVIVMLKQFQYYYKIEDKQIEEIMEHKIDRQLERIDLE